MLWGFSWVVASGGYYLVALGRILFAVAPLLQSMSSRVLGPSPCGAWAQSLWRVGSVLVARGPSTYGTWAQSLWHVGSALVACGLSTCGMWALEHTLNGCGAQAWLLCGMWDLPRSGIEPMCPALTGRFFTTEPLGKTYSLIKTLRPIGLYLIVVALNPLPHLAPPPFPLPTVTVCSLCL